MNPRRLMLGLSVWQWILISFGAYVGWSIEWLWVNQMGEILFFEKHFSTTGSGPKFIPKFFMRIVRFPTNQIRLTLKIPITPASAETARFYSGDSVRLLKEFEPAEREALLADPLNHRFPIMVEVTFLYTFVEESLYQFLRRIKTGRELKRQLSEAMKNVTEGIFGHITVGTALEKKSLLGKEFNDKINEIVAFGTAGNPIWGIRGVLGFIGPIDIDPLVEKQYAEAAAALAEKKQRITLAEAESKEISLRGMGRAQAIAPLAELMKTPEGEKAVMVETAREIYQGSTGKVVVTSGGLAGAIISMDEVIKSLDKK